MPKHRFHHYNKTEYMNPATSINISKCKDHVFFTHLKGRLDDERHRDVLSIRQTEASKQTNEKVFEFYKSSKAPNT